MITINIKNSIKANGEKGAFVTFPFNMEIVSIMRNQPSRFWHADSKEWELPTNNLIKFIKDARNFEINLIGDVNGEVAKSVKIPEGFSYKTTPFTHQEEGLEYGLNYDKFLLGDEQGLGKTKQVIDIAVAKKLQRGYKHCLIICGVNGLKWNWQAEIGTHSNEDSIILGTKLNAKGKATVGSSKDKLADLNNLANLKDKYFLIINVESLRYTENVVDAKGKKKAVYPIQELITKLCDDGTIGMVAIDEIHKCKNPTSQQGKAILKIQPETRIAMTGTPLMNTPLDLFIVLKWLGYEKHSFYQFKKHHCNMGGYGGYQVMSYKNLNELQTNLDNIMIRRLKKNVLDLPDKIHSIDYVEMTAAQAIIYKEVQEEIKSNIDMIKVSSHPLTQLVRLRQATGYPGILSSKVTESAKLDRLEEIVEELRENGEKCIVFSNWTSMTDVIMERLSKYNPAIITGETKNRVEQQDKFMKDKSCGVIIGTIGAMGTGLTLTEATTVIFMDSPWNRALKEQAEDRAHRIGTKSNVNIITLVAKDTIDERIEELISKKGKMADALVDGEIQNGRTDLIDFLLS